jgi:hypothetical protein
VSLGELLPVVRLLAHQDKLRLLQFLAGELAREQGIPEIQPGAAYPFWSPYDAFEAAAGLERALGAEVGKP